MQGIFNLLDEFSVEPGVFKRFNKRSFIKVGYIAFQLYGCLFFAEVNRNAFNARSLLQSGLDPRLATESSRHAGYGKRECGQ